MKKNFLTLFAAILFISATLTASAQKEETRQVSGFNAISSGGSFEVNVKIDGTESLKLSADASVIDKIETVVEDGKLEIRFKRSHDWGMDNYGKIKVYVTAKSLSALSVSGSGAIKVEGALTGDAQIHVSGSGDIFTVVKASNLQASISGSGSAKLSGNAEDGHLSVSGSGSIHAEGLKLANAYVSISGSGSARVNVDKTLDANIGGSGHITYSGNASVNEVHSGRSSHISRAE